VQLTTHRRHHLGFFAARSPRRLTVETAQGLSLDQALPFRNRSQTIAVPDGISAAEQRPRASKCLKGSEIIQR